MMGYEYAVRYREKGVNGWVSDYYDFAEWSCGCPRLYRTFGEAEEIARNWRADVTEGICDYMTNVEVVRRPISDWEAVDETTASGSLGEVGGRVEC